MPNETLYGMSLGKSDRNHLLLTHEAEAEEDVARFDRAGMSVGGAAEAGEVVPGAAFHDGAGAIAPLHQSRSKLKHIPGHVFHSIGTAAEGKSSDRASVPQAAVCPIGSLIAPFIAPGEIAPVCAASRFFPFQGRG